MKYNKICFLNSGSPKSVEAIELFKKDYQNYPLDEADVVVTLGGDGFLLEGELVYSLISSESIVAINW